MITYIPPILVTLEVRMINKFWAFSPISFQDKSISCPFLDPHLTMQHWNVGVHLK